MAAMTRRKKEVTDDEMDALVIAVVPALSVGPLRCHDPVE
jgi:hypothetical protein